MRKDGIPNFIVVDGPDGCGKTTAINNMVNYLKQINPELNVVVGKGLGSGNVSERIRESLFNKTIAKSVKYEIYGFIMSLIDCYETFVTPKLAKDDIVILDRYLSSFYAYQVVGRNSIQAGSMLKDCFNTFTTIQPDYYIHLTCSNETSIKRLNLRNDLNYLDNETIEFKNKVNKGYREFFTNLRIIFHCCNPSKIINIDAEQSQADVNSDLFKFCSANFSRTVKDTAHD